MMCVCVCVCVKKKKKKKKKELSLAKNSHCTGSCVVQDQALQQWWSIRSALQPDRWHEHYVSA